MENASPKYHLMFIIFIYLVMEETPTSSTDLEEINTEDELATDTSEYQKVFGNRASLCTIIRKLNFSYESPYTIFSMSGRDARCRI